MLTCCKVLGSTPCAFLVMNKGRTLNEGDKQRLRQLVRKNVGSVAVPSKIITTAELPCTHSGK